MTRLQSEIKVAVRQKIIGGPLPLVCIPLVAENQSALLDQAMALRPLIPDLVEWRVDGYDDVEDTTGCIAALEALRPLIGNIPLIFTCRVESEGGMQTITRETRLRLIKAATRSGLIDIVDIELCNPPAFIESIRETTIRQGTRLILSYHDFTQTPDETFIVDKLNEAQTRGADIAKVAVMPNRVNDVLTLLNATMKARSGTLKIPMATMAMAREGVITRMAGGLFGSDITFAVGTAVSAPGQIPVDELRRSMELLYDT